MKIGKIIGLPTKIFENNQIYIPKEYLSFYGISKNSDKILICQHDHSLTIRSQNAQIVQNEKRISIHQGLFHMPVGWLQKNKLGPGDIVYWLGTEEGLVLYVGKTE